MRLVQSGKLHVMRALRFSSAARASEHPLSLRLRIRIWRREKNPGKQIDPRNQPNRPVGSDTLISLAIMPNQCGDAVHRHALDTPRGLD
jgi:hypothetical protein